MHHTGTLPFFSDEKVAELECFPQEFFFFLSLHYSSLLQEGCYRGQTFLLKAVQKTVISFAENNLIHPPPHPSLHQWVLSFFMSWLEAAWDTLDRVRFCFRLVSCLIIYLFMFKKINSKILDLIVFRYTGNQDLKSTHRAICSVINNISSRCGMSYWGFIV